MITVALSATIGAQNERVWRALIDPSERESWDERILGEVALARTPRKAAGIRNPRAGSPDDSGPMARKGAHKDIQAVLRKTRWRFKLGGVPLVMQEEILTADSHERLKSRISIGSLHFDQTLTLYSEDDETGPQTRLGMKIVARNSIAVIGEVVPRLDVQKLVIEYVDTTLRQVQKYCEADA